MSFIQYLMKINSFGEFHILVTITWVIQIYWNTFYKNWVFHVLLNLTKQEKFLNSLQVNMSHTHKRYTNMHSLPVNILNSTCMYFINAILFRAKSHIYLINFTPSSVRITSPKSLALQNEFDFTGIIYFHL